MLLLHKLLRMKRKILIGFITVLLLLITVFLGFLAYFAYKLSSNADTVAPTDSVTTVETSDTVTTDTTGAPSTASTMSSSITIPISTLPESQQSVLRTLGYTDVITFTPDMVSCAEAKLGVDRVAEIKNGSTPSAMEVIKLTPCL